MSAVEETAPPGASPPGGSPLGVPTRLGLVALVGGGLLSAAAVAALVTAGNYQLAAAAALIVPIGLLMYQRPFSAIVVWLLVAPLVMVVDGGGGGRRVFWLVHRFLPLAAVGAILMRAVLAQAVDRLPRLGLPELCMAGYVVASVVSVLYTSPEPLADIYLLYDRIVVPMLLYVVIRLSRPSDQDLRSWYLVLVVLVLSQAAIGILSWVAPEVLPSHWLNRAGSRTTGSLRHPNVYAISLLFAAVLCLHLAGRAGGWLGRRVLPSVVLVVACAMAFLTLSRAAWLATIVMLAGVARLHLRAALVAMTVAVVAVIGLLQTDVLVVDAADVSDRFYSSASEQSALSRLPVVMASLGMFEAKPMTGWGYGRFDDFDHQFQRPIDRLYVPDKDHASHNFYLTLLAEQGLPGFLLYVVPAVWLLVQSHRYGIWRAGSPDWRLAVSLWLVIAGHVIISNFANMRVAFGLGVWWVSLALIATLVDRARLARAVARSPLPTLAPLLRAGPS
ncbi:O-antigen ligase family protein [Egicoccus sp. AB-alg2]|uniref:O-antigen ligase family protein n=1 Tax=Egicoccus sp. AB-alg2 TaxID=3242693 RepID=UPI00359E323E